MAASVFPVRVCGRETERSGGETREFWALQTFLSFKTKVCCDKKEEEGVCRDDVFLPLRGADKLAGNIIAA